MSTPEPSRTLPRTAGRHRARGQVDLGCLAAFLIPWQVRLGSSDLSPVVTIADVIIVLMVATEAVARWPRLVRSASRGGLAMVCALGVSVLLNLTLTRYAIFSKLLGLAALVAWAAVVRIKRDRDPSYGRRVIRWLVIGVALASAMGLVDYIRTARYGHSALLNDLYPRLTASAIDPNAFAGLAAAALAITVVGLASGRPITRRSIDVGFASILAAALALTYSRSGFLALGAGLLATMAGRTRVAMRLVIASAIVLTAVVAIGLESFGLRPELLEREHTIDGRVETITAGLRLVPDSPATGAGLGSSVSRFGTLPHNTFLWLLIEAGLIGALAFLWFLGENTRSFWHHGRHHGEDALSAWVGFCACVGLSLGIEALYQRQWWLFAGLLLAGPRRRSPGRLARRVAQ